MQMESEIAEYIESFSSRWDELTLREREAFKETVDHFWGGEEMMSEQMEAWEPDRLSGQTSDEDLPF